MKPPYSLSQTAVGFIFLVYLVGTFSSTWISRQIRQKKNLPFSLVIVMIGVCITLSADIEIMILGVAIFHIRLFAGHSISSSWVGELAVRDKSTGRGLIFVFLLCGREHWGTASGAFYHQFGWGGIAVMITALSAVSAAVSSLAGIIDETKKINTNRRLSFELQINATAE